MTSKVAVQEAFKLALSMALMFGVALWMDWDMPSNGALAIILISLGSTGASLRKGAMRIAGTTLGLIVGLFVLSFLSQDRWLALAFFFVYAVVIGYVMQMSRYGYAWYVAGFLPSTVWASTYMAQDLSSQGFQYASFRYLETTTGIVIYTLVCILLWNRSAGQQLQNLSVQFFDDTHQLFEKLRSYLADGSGADQLPLLRGKLAGTSTQILATLDAAYADTRRVIDDKKVWEALRINNRALTDSIDLWSDGLGDARLLDLASELPELESFLTAIDGRLNLCVQLCQAQITPPKDTKLDDVTKLLDSPPLEPDGERVSKLSHSDRAVLMNFINQLRMVEQTSRETVRLLRVLADIDTKKDFRSETTPVDMVRPVIWDPQKLVKALFPAVCFAVAFLFWIYTNPPGGASVPSTTMAIVLMSNLGPIKPLNLLLVTMTALWVAVAPVYMFVMPQLSTGPELLTLIFIFTFIFGYLGRFNPSYKLMPILLFVEMTGISNNQHYSFMTMVGGAMVLILPISVIAVVYMFWLPMRPENILRYGLKRFCHGCRRVIGGFTLILPDQRKGGRKLRKRFLESMILPAPRQLQMVAKQLDYRMLPDDSPEKVDQLISGIQSIAFRLQALEIVHTRVVGGFDVPVEPFGEMGVELAERLQRVFEHWSNGEHADALDSEIESLREISKKLEQHLDALEVSFATTNKSNLLSQDYYALLGSVRGLVSAMKFTQEAVRAINWHKLSVARF